MEKEILEKALRFLKKWINKAVLMWRSTTNFVLFAVDSKIFLIFALVNSN